MGNVTGSYLIARTLKEEGVEVLFYLMGGPNFDIVMACQDLGIKTVDFRHEQAAAFAAHAYARLTGKPGVCTAASGPGTLNLLTGVYTASIDCAPMIILGGAVAATWQIGQVVASSEHARMPRLGARCSPSSRQR